MITFEENTMYEPGTPDVQFTFTTDTQLSSYENVDE